MQTNGFNRRKFLISSPECCICIYIFIYIYFYLYYQYYYFPLFGFPYYFACFSLCSYAGIWFLFLPFPIDPLRTLFTQCSWTLELNCMRSGLPQKNEVELYSSPRFVISLQSIIHNQHHLRVSTPCSLYICVFF